MTVAFPLPVSKNVHPQWVLCQAEVAKWRYVFTGGAAFRDLYLRRFNARESEEEFNYRRNVTYIPTPAKACIQEIANSIIEKLPDVERTGGPESYRRAVEAGIDGFGHSLNSFLANNVIGELLAMQKVGIYVDRYPFPGTPTRADADINAPYVYTYRREDIINWTYDQRHQLLAVYLRELVDDYDPQTKLITGQKLQYRRLLRQESDVRVEILNENEEVIDTSYLNLSMLPFFMLELPASLLADIADHQIAILNLGSTDIVYGLRSNFPFYTEQYDPSTEAATRLMADQGTETPDATKKADSSAAIGTTRGRRYSKGMERPGFIHPSPEPLFASMEKQAALKIEIREQLNRSLAAIDASRVSAYTIKEDRSDRDRGMSAIGMEIEFGENQLAKIWADYEKEEPARIHYPKSFNLRSETERKAEAKEILGMADKIPSPTAQKELKKQAIRLLLEANRSKDVMDKIDTEIDKIPVASIDPETLRLDNEAGFVSKEYASELRNYPKGEVEKAKTEHVERALKIAEAQSSAALKAPGARGVPDLSVTPETEANKEKTQ